MKNNNFEKGRKMKKKKIREKIMEITNALDGRKLFDSIEILEMIKIDKEKSGYSDLEIEKKEDYSFGCGYRIVEFYLYGTREETDKEYEKRMKLNKRKREQNKQNKVKQKNREIKRLKELIKKYPEESKIE